LKDVIKKAAEAGRPDVVITDPPRAGMHPKVIKTLLEVAPELPGCCTVTQTTFDI
jgi:23S rRNA (uracil1939-C5)-methyltransferase